MAHNDESWRGDWQISEENDPVPTARHRSGLVFWLEYQQVSEEGDWGWTFGEAEQSEMQAEELRREMGNDAYWQYWSELKRQAMTLWQELGYTHETSRKGPPILSGDKWRSRWTVSDEDGGDVIPHARHSSGLAVRFIYTEVDEDQMGWCATVPAGDQGRLEELRTQLGEDELVRLFAEAQVLWEELGYTDDSPAKKQS